jgi:hypothetical protein
MNISNKGAPRHHNELDSGALSDAACRDVACNYANTSHANTPVGWIEREL